MKRFIISILAAIVIWPMTATAEDWTVNGKDYHNVTVGQIEADRVHISYDGGVGTILLTDLPPDLQKRFNYDPVAAAKATAIEQAKEAASDAEVAKIQQMAAAAEAAKNKVVANAQTSTTQQQAARQAEAKRQYQALILEEEAEKNHEQAVGRTSGE